MQVLVIDDEESIRSLVSDILTVGGHTSEVVEDGQKGLVLVQDRKFDLVITDNDMPLMTGVRFVKEVRKSNIKIPIIMLSGRAAVMQKPQGVDILLAKPFGVQELLNAIDQAVKMHSEANVLP